jgi:hypothetical protein
MKPPGSQTTAVPASTESETTGLPGLRSWRGVYLLVLGVLVLWIGLLTALTRMYP